MFSELVKIGNLTKSIGDYDLANAIFAVALNRYFGLSLDERDTNRIWLVWESQDEAGEYPQEVYYDLLNIETAEPTETGYHLFRLCIPIPLLDSFAAITALKCANMEARGEHGREEREPEEGEIEDLWERLFAIADKFEIEEAMNQVLDTSECELVFERVASRIKPEIKEIA